MTDIKLDEQADGTADADITAEGIEITIKGATVETIPYVPPAPPAEPPPVDPPVDPNPPAESPVDPPADQPVKPVIIGQTLTSDKNQVNVGDTFTLTGLLNYSDGSTQPVSAYALFGFNTSIINNGGKEWHRTFTAIAAGGTKIKNDNRGTTGQLAVTVLAADATPPYDPPPANPPPIDPPLPPPPPAGDGSHLVVASTIDAASRWWFAQAYVGDDATAAGQHVPFTDKDGNEHPALVGDFYADCCHASVRGADNNADYLGFQPLVVTYDGSAVPVPHATNGDGTYDFWRGCWMPPIRYGKQVGWDASKVDWSLLPSYAKVSQKAFDDSKLDYSWNGRGCASTWGMGGQGERWDIGNMDVVCMAFLTDPCDATWEVLVRHDDWASNWPIYFSALDGGILDIETYPTANTMPAAQQTGIKNNPIVPYLGSYTGDVLAKSTDAWQITKSPGKPNGAHLTSYALLTAMVTGTAHDRDNASFWCNWPLLEINPGYTATGGVVLGAPRRFAWCLRNLFLGCYISSNCDYFQRQFDKQLPIIEKHSQNKFGFVDTAVPYTGRGAGAGYTGVSSFQQFYLAMALDPIARKVPVWQPTAQYVGKLAATWFSKPYALVMTLYSIMIRDPSGAPMTDFDEIVRISLQSQYGYTLDEANAVVNAATVQDAYNAVNAFYTRAKQQWGGKCVNGIADFRGTDAAADSYPAQAIAAVIAAHNCGTAGTDAALDYVQNVPTPPDYSANGKYHLAPWTA